MAGTYADKMWERHTSRQALEAEKMDGKIIDESGAIPESAGASKVQEARAEQAGAKGNYGAAAQLASQGASTGNAAGLASGGLMAYGAMSANPWLIGAGLGVQVLAQGEANKRAQQNAQREAYNERIKQRQMLMSQIASQGIQ